MKEKTLAEKREVLKVFLVNLGIPQNKIRLIVQFVKGQDKEKVLKLKKINFEKRRFRIINDIDKIFGEFK